jgi:hypothetical protein
VIFLLAGLLTADPLWQALLPATLYVGLHLIEGRNSNADASGQALHSQSRPRHHLARLLVLDVGVFPGAILSVPMLAITKIICDRIRPLAALGHFLER